MMNALALSFGNPYGSGLPIGCCGFLGHPIIAMSTPLYETLLHTPEVWTTFVGNTRCQVLARQGPGLSDNPHQVAGTKAFDAARPRHVIPGLPSIVNPMIDGPSSPPRNSTRPAPLVPSSHLEALDQNICLRSAKPRYTVRQFWVASLLINML